MNEFEWLLTILEDEIAKVETEDEWYKVTTKFWELVHMHQERKTGIEKEWYAITTKFWKLVHTHQEWGERLTKIRNRLQQWDDDGLTHKTIKEYQ